MFIVFSFLFSVLFFFLLCSCAGSSVNTRSFPILYSTQQHIDLSMQPAVNSKYPENVASSSLY